MRGGTGECGSHLNDESFDVVCQHEVLSHLFFIQRFFHVQSLTFDLDTLFSVALHITICLVPLCTQTPQNGETILVRQLQFKFVLYAEAESDQLHSYIIESDLAGQLITEQKKRSF